MTITTRSVVTLLVHRLLLLFLSLSALTHNSNPSSSISSSNNSNSNASTSVVYSWTLVPMSRNLRGLRIRHRLAGLSAKERIGFRPAGHYGSPLDSHDDWTRYGVVGTARTTSTTQWISMRPSAPDSNPDMDTTDRDKEENNRHVSSLVESHRLKTMSSRLFFKTKRQFHPLLWFSE